MSLVKTAAGILIALSVGFGAPAPFVASYLLREGRLPIFMGLFPAYGNGLFQRFSPATFAVLLGVFTAVNAFDVFAGVLLWGGHKLGAYALLGALPVQVVFWLGFALPIPPLLTFVLLGLLWAGRGSLH